MIFFYGFMAAFCMIFLKGFQYQNVIGGHYKATILVSFCMTVAEVCTITFVVAEGLT